VVLCNHSAVQGQHLNNTVMYTPIYAGAGRTALIGFFAINVHWIEIGGIQNNSTDIFMEGLQLRSIKLWSKGEPIEEVYRIIECNTRMPNELLGDIAAQAGDLAHQAGGDEGVLFARGHEYGLDALIKVTVHGGKLKLELEVRDRAQAAQDDLGPFGDRVSDSALQRILRRLNPLLTIAVLFTITGAQIVQCGPARLTDLVHESVAGCRHYGRIWADRGGDEHN
jgi:hypothetical protein